MTLYPVPKPPKVVRRSRAKLKNRTPVKRVNKKRGGSSFPKVRDKGLTRWVVTQDCVLAGHWTARALSQHDYAWFDMQTGALIRSGKFQHRCWGDKTPMHVGQHRAKGAPDRNRVVCACKAAHQEYDEHRSRWYRVTHWTEKRLREKARALTAAYDLRGGDSEVLGPCP